MAEAGPGARQLAEMFHERYERLAPSFGYVTREETRAFDPTSTNGRLMIAVCDEILTWFELRVTADELARLRDGLREIQEAALKTWNYSAAAPFPDCPFYLGLIRGTAERCLSGERVADETPTIPPGVMDVLKLQAQTDAAVAGLNPLMKCPICGMGYFKHPMQD